MARLDNILLLGCVPIPDPFRRDTLFTNALTAAQVKMIYQAATTPVLEILSFTNSTGQLQLNWAYGTLQSAINVTGPYADLTNVSPYIVPVTNSQQFFRVKEN